MSVLLAWKSGNPIEEAAECISGLYGLVVHRRTLIYAYAPHVENSPLRNAVYCAILQKKSVFALHSSPPLKYMFYPSSTDNDLLIIAQTH